MILGIGFDLAEAARFERILAGRSADRFVRRVFTDAERDYCDRYRVPEDRAARYAARFAAKEALIKAIGTRRGVRWKDVEVVRAGSGKPSLRLAGVAAEHASRRGATSMHLTLTHDAGLAAAVVVLEGA